MRVTAHRTRWDRLAVKADDIRALTAFFRLEEIESDTVHYGERFVTAEIALVDVFVGLANLARQTVLDPFHKCLVTPGGVQ